MENSVIFIPRHRRTLLRPIHLGIYGLALCGSYGWRLMGAYEGKDQHAHVQNDPGCPEDLGIKIECDAQTQGDNSDKEGQKQNHPQFLFPYEIRKLFGNHE